MSKIYIDLKKYNLLWGALCRQSGKRIYCDFTLQFSQGLHIGSASLSRQDREYRIIIYRLESDVANEIDKIDLILLFKRI